MLQRFPLESTASTMLNFSEVLTAPQPVIILRSVKLVMYTPASDGIAVSVVPFGFQRSKRPSVVSTKLSRIERTFIDCSKVTLVGVA